MTLPPRIPKAPKRFSRWRSQAHCNFIRSHACSVPGCAGRPIEVAHVRIGSGAGMGQKPDDWHAVSLCRECHQRQHTEGERTFWEWMLSTHQIHVNDLINAFCAASPKAREIREARNA